MKTQNENNPSPLDYREIHDFARHILHSSETLEVALYNLKSLVDNQRRWRSKHSEMVDSSAVTRSSWLQAEERLISMAANIHSFQIKTRSLTERLQNETNMVLTFCHHFYLSK